MPKFSSESLSEFTGEVLRATGFSPEDSDTIARLMISSNLRGHDSHGFRNLTSYLERIKKGEIVPDAKVDIVHETPTTAILDGNRTLGHVAATQALRLGVKKAREVKISAVGVRNVDHVGRVGAYPEMAAEEGMICLAYVNAQARGRLVTPFGGVQRRIGTNPISAGFPNPLGAPILLDFATSTVAANKVRLAKERGTETGPGWIVDKDGNPSRNPDAFMDGLGMLLPLGGGQGYKGYAMAVMVDIMGGILAGSGTAASSKKWLDNGTFFIVIDPEAFVAKADYDFQIKELLGYLHATSTRPGDPPVMVPGEFEARHLAQRSVEGIEIESAVWENILAAVRELGVAAPAPMA